jgi:hypothetical protein
LYIILNCCRTPSILRLQRAYCSFPRWEPRWNDINRENSWLVHQSSLAVLPAVTL